MNKETGKPDLESEAERHSDDTVAKLMNLAGPMGDIPAEIEARVHKKVSQDWRNATNMKITLQWSIPAAIAATVLIVMAFNFRATEMPLQPVGFVAQASDIPGLALGDTVYAGSNLATVADGGLSISLNGAVSLRLAPDTTVRIDSADSIALIRGQLYADSGERIYRDQHITVHTNGGSATDIGTQFSVSYDDHGMSIAVREGRVDVSRDQSVITADAGDRLILQPGRNAVFGQITAYDPAWDWATSLAPGFDIKDRSLLDFLKWASRETGKSLVFSNDDVRTAAMRTDLFGSILHFTPDEAIAAVLSTTNFSYKVDEKSISISM